MPRTQFLVTRHRGDERELTLSAIQSGCAAIAVVGGDGTCARVANAIMESGSNCALGIVPCGTGNDFAKTLGVESMSAEGIATLFERGETTAIDAGSVDGVFFINSLGFGFDASVLEASNRVRFLKGDAVYIYSALKQLLTYPGLEVTANRVLHDSGKRKLMVTVSNGKYLGGAFKIAPEASVTDGMLDVSFFDDSGVVERIRLFAGAFRGTHMGMSSVSSGRVDSLTLTFDRPPSMEVDGELRVARERIVEVKCLPRALSVIAAPGALD